MSGFSISYRQSALWPESGDALLLQAALLPDERALHAWRAWQQQLGQAPIDFTQLRLLPLLHHNLRALGVPQDALGRYRNDTMVFWIRNQELFRFACAEIRCLEKGGIGTLVLKGVPLAVRFYPAPGLRPMGDVDVLVKPEQAQQAITLFTERGWACSDEFVLCLDRLDELVAVRNGLNLRDPVTGREIDLHWNLLKNCLANAESLWSDAVSFELNGQTLRTLNPSDQLVHSCAQAADWNVLRPIRWIPDAAMILRNARIDWDRVIVQAQRMDLVDVVRDALGVLREFLALEVPEDTVSRLHAGRSSLLSRIDYRAAAHPPIPLVGRPLMRVVRYLRIGRPQGLGFFQYLKYMWGTRSIFDAFVNGLRLVWDERFKRRDG